MSIRQDVLDWGCRDPRAVWLAAYPRSGITFTRMLLSYCLGLKTDSLYTEGYIGENYLDLIRAAPEDGDEARDALADEQGVLPIKTHRPPDGGRAIVVVRDGRTTLQSLRDFYAELCRRSVSADQIIAGDHAWGDWSVWVNAWLGQPDTLWLKYEDLRANPISAVETIAAFLGKDVVTLEMPSFATAHELHPWMFRNGQRENRWSEEDENKFWARHGDAMAALGYTKTGEGQCG